MPVFFYKDAVSLTLFSLIIQTRRCSRIRSRFPSIFTPAAFPHAAVLAYDRIFSLCICTCRCSIIRTRFWLLLLSCEISHAAVLAYYPIFTAITLSPHSNTPLLTRANAFSFAKGMLTRCGSHSELYFHCFLLSYHSHIMLFYVCCSAIF